MWGCIYEGMYVEYVLYVGMYACMWGRVYVCGDVCMCVGMYVFLWGCKYVCGVCVGMYVGVWGSMYVCGDKCTGWGAQSWTIFCGPAAVAVGGCERKY
jgi:hypothetical protein